MSFVYIRYTFKSISRLGDCLFSTHTNKGILFVFCWFHSTFTFLAVNNNITKASDEEILQNIFGVWSPGKSYDLFLQKFLDILMCFSMFSLSWKIYMCSCTIFGFPEILMLSDKRIICLLLENSYVFLLHPSLLENMMCSRNLFKKSHSWKKRTDILAK